MKTRRHHNNKGFRQIKRGKTRRTIEALAQKIAAENPMTLPSQEAKNRVLLRYPKARCRKEEDVPIFWVEPEEAKRIGAAFSEAGAWLNADWEIGKGMKPTKVKGDRLDIRYIDKDIL